MKLCILLRNYKLTYKAFYTSLSSIMVLGARVFVGCVDGNVRVYEYRTPACASTGTVEEDGGCVLDEEGGEGARAQGDCAGWRAYTHHVLCHAQDRIRFFPTPVR